MPARGSDTAGDFEAEQSQCQRELCRYHLAEGSDSAQHVLHVAAGRGRPLS